MRKTSVQISAALLLGLALIGGACGGRNDSSSAKSTETTASDSKEVAFIDPAADCTDYKGTQGVTGDTIKIGTVRPESGSYAIYDNVTKGLDAYFKSANASGGLTAKDGKKYQIELIKKNDEYDPAKTPALVKQLVEQDGVFALVGNIGTETNKSVRDYLNENCVPNIALATGSTQWGDANAYPWYISGLPSYATEANAWVSYLKEVNPTAKIALLYQDDDFGQSYKAAIEKAIKGTKITLVAKEGFNPLAGSTTEASVTKLSQSGADTFIVGVGGTACPLTLSFVPATWTPMTMISVTCGSKTALSLASGKDEGVYMAQPTLDPADPADQSNPKVIEFATQGAAAGLDESAIQGGIASVGWGFGALFAEGLKNASTVDRAAVMNALYSLNDTTFGLLRDEVTVNTDGAKDPWAIEGFRIVQRENGAWVEKAPVTNEEGKSNSFAGN